MKAWAMVCAVLLLASASVLAQSMRPITVTPEAVRAMEVDPSPCKPHVDRNKQLRAENEALKARIDGFTRLGGSHVVAYCENPSTSRNTAGASADCSLAGYNCEPVSGQCRTTCQTSDMCSGGFVCDTGARQCVRP